MNLFEEVCFRIPDRDNLRGLISDVFVQREVEVESGRVVATIVVTTERRMTLEGGDGWNGIDGSDVEVIRRAVHDMLNDEEALGFVKNIIIKESRQS